MADRSTTVFRYLTQTQWLEENVPAHLTDAYLKAMEELHHYGQVVNVGPLLDLLHDREHGYDTYYSSEYTVVNDFFSDEDIPSNLDAATFAQFKNAAHQAYEDAANLLQMYKRFEERAWTEFGLGPLGFEYYEDRRSKGWTMENADLPDGLGRLLLTEDWDTNHPDRGVQFTLRIAGARRPEVFWTSRWVTEEEIPDVAAEVKPYFTNIDTFMVLYHLHRLQVEF